MVPLMFEGPLASRKRRLALGCSCFSEEAMKMVGNHMEAVR